MATNQDALDDLRREALLGPEVQRAVEDALGALVQRHGSHAMRRVVQCVENAVAGGPVSYEHPMQRPGFLYFPGLATRSWFEPNDHASTRAMASAFAESFPAIRREAENLVSGADSSWTRYMEGAYDDHKFFPLKGPEWKAFKVRWEGDWTAGADACPATKQALQSVMPHLTSHGEAFFSKLQPKVRIPPHYDDTNFKLTLHVGVIVPPDCGIRVGGEARTWREGECLIFDETIQHEAWNDSDRPRVVLIVDIWHPDLTAPEIEAVTMFTAMLRRLAAHGALDDVLAAPR